MTLSAALFLIGCTDGSYLPTVKFNRLDVNEITWDDIDTDFVFDVTNPNPIDIELARFDYSLAFSEVEWLTGDDPDGLELGASGDSEVALPVGLVFQSLYEMVQASKGQDDIPFALSGSFGFDTPIGPIDLPYDAGGDFPALRTPKFQFSKIRVPKVSLSTVELAIDLDVSNDHGSNLIFQNFAYDLSISGNYVGTGSIANLGEVLGASDAVLTIPVELSTFGVGAAIYDALTTGRVDLGLSAASDVETPFGLVPLSLDQSGAVDVEF